MTELTRRNYVDGKHSLAAFVRLAWPIVEPGKTLLWNWHLDLLCEYLEAITFRATPCEAWREAHPEFTAEAITRLIVNEPPGYMKSLIISVMWPCWEWLHYPSRRTLASSYSSDLSTQHSLSRRRIIESEWYVRGMHEHWALPDFGLVGDQNVKTHYDNTARGRMLSTSTGGMGTGTHGDTVIVDDPLNPEEAYSDAKRDRANRYFDQTLSTRLTDKRSGVFVIVMQRLHQKDLTGHVLEQDTWVHVVLPAVAEADEAHVFPRSGRVVTRATGELLWPEREGETEITAVKARLGSYGFAGQYQQRPAPMEGGVIKRAYFTRRWVRELRPEDDPDTTILLPAHFTATLQSWDMTYWETDTADYCIGQAWGLLAANRFLLDQDRKRRDLPGSKAALRAFHPEIPLKLVERAANGSEVLRSMRDEIPGLVGRKPQGSKLARLMAQLGTLEAGNVILPHPREAAWVAGFVAECLDFPNGEHDDQVDAMSQALAEWNGVANDVPALGTTTYTSPTPARFGGTHGSTADVPHVAVR